MEIIINLNSKKMHQCALIKDIIILSILFYKSFESAIFVQS